MLFVFPNAVKEVIYYSSGCQLICMNIIDDLCGAVHQMRRLPLCATYSLMVKNVDNPLAKYSFQLVNGRSFNIIYVVFSCEACKMLIQTEAEQEGKKPGQAMPPERCLICVPLIAKTVPEMILQMEMAKTNGADVVELRVDHISGFDAATDLPSLLNARPLPVIVTARAEWEGGEWEGDEETRQNLLHAAVELGAEYIDVELKVAEEFIRKAKGSKKVSQTKIIVSNHNWETTPSKDEIHGLLAQMQSTGADIIKFVTTAQDITDVSRVLEILAHSQMPTIALAMGPKGMLARLLAPKFGGYLTFGALSKGQESAPGQPTVQELAQVYRVGHVGRDTMVLGIVGNPVYHSKGPSLHNAALQKCGVDGVYVPFLVENFEDFLRVYNTPDFHGFSVTIPHKEEALRLCDVADPVAKDIGAVNTIVRGDDGRLYGYNTDCDGALSAIEDGLRDTGLASCDKFPLKDKLVVVIGAGGAGKSLAYGAKVRGARVAVANRNFARAKVLADAVGGEAIELDKLGDFRPETGMILANSTSVGMQPDICMSPIPKEALSAYCLVFDAVYTPKETQLLKDAAEAGAVTVVGEEMFFRQAFAQFELFTGISAPKQVMRDVLSKGGAPCKGFPRTGLAIKAQHSSAMCSIGKKSALGRALEVRPNRQVPRASLNTLRLGVLPITSLFRQFQTPVSSMGVVVRFF